MIRIDDVALFRGPKAVLEKADLVVQRGQKVGVVGANGAGKSSLVQMILGGLAPDRGRLDLPAGLDIATIAQQTPSGPQALIDYVIEGDARIAAIRARLARASSRGDALAEASAHSDLEAIHGHGAEAAAARILRGLGFAPEDEPRSLDDLSGGMRMRAALARTLTAPCDLLLLDEPTNHLDVDAVLWLEAWLRRHRGTLLVISHDQEFLDPVVDHIALISGGRIFFYTGNYSEFERRRGEDIRRSHQLAERQGRERARMEAFVERFRAKASKARQAQSRLKALARMEEITPLPIASSSDYRFEFPGPEHLPRPLLTLDGASFGYGERTVLHDIGMTLVPGDRIALLGANGMGKSTLMRGMAAALAPRSGRMERSPRTKIGYFTQHRIEQIDLRSSPLDLVRTIDPAMREQQARDFLGGFGFGADAVVNPVEPLSGGEKTRLALALLLLERPNLLLLDEPTNHLDIDMRRALALALQSFPGALVLVSHDRHLLRLVSDSLWLVAKGQVQPFKGDLDDYRTWLLSGLSSAQSALSAEAMPDESSNAGSDRSDLEPPSRPSALRKKDRQQKKREEAERRQRIAPLKRAVTDLESEIDRLGKERAEIGSLLADSATYQEMEHEQLQELLARHRRLEGEIERAESAWLEKSESLAELNARINEKNEAEEIS
ncbi:MAG: ATP-binding cassette domain-containing protein [Ectothiorhodospiraceae bacterium AqS1]|nr:ATP-binding cassette domain-containing protein [Ectothiorhodospiraceae bacterium AqS1]